jgi:spore coat protein A
MISRRRLLEAGVALAVPWKCDGGSCSRKTPPFAHPRMQHGPAAAPSSPPRSFDRYVDALPIPRVLAPEGTRPDPHDAARQIPHYRVEMREIEGQIHRDLPPTRLWTYDGSMPGPTIEARSGHGLWVEWHNELPERHLFPIDHGLCGAGANEPPVRAVVHVHGAKVPPESDGYPTEWYAPGGSARVHYPIRQDATMLWYHDHAMGITRLNNYAGLFGVFLVRDEVEDALRLPSGPFEIPLVICDRLIDRDGHLRYPTSGTPDAPWVPEVYGDALLVNGKLFPYLEVEPRRYRFRVLNASNGRIFYPSFGGRTFHQIGTDQGLLPAPLPLEKITLAPAERADLLVDFSDAAGSTIVVRSQAFELMQFRVKGGASARPEPLPVALRPVPKTPRTAAVKTRTLTLDEYEDPKSHRMLMLLDGKYWHDPVSEKPALGTVEIWNLVNLTEDTHPIHLHLVRFEILERQAFDADEYKTSGSLRLLGKPVPPAPEEAGFKDTVRAEPGMITRIIVRFEGYAGRYVWHCHLLEHEDNEMMRPYDVVAV